MLDRCSIPSSHYWIGNIDWLEQALTLHIKDCVYQHRNGNTNTYSTWTTHSSQCSLGGKRIDSLKTHRDSQRETHTDDTS